MTTLTCPYCREETETREPFLLLFTQWTGTLHTACCERPFTLHYESMWDDENEADCSFFWSESCTDFEPYASVSIR